MKKLSKVMQRLLVRMLAGERAYSCGTPWIARKPTEQRTLQALCRRGLVKCLGGAWWVLTTKGDRMARDIIALIVPVDLVHHGLGLVQHPLFPHSWIRFKAWPTLAKDDRVQLVAVGNGEFKVVPWTD